MATQLLVLADGPAAGRYEIKIESSDGVIELLLPEPLSLEVFAVEVDGQPEMKVRSLPQGGGGGGQGRQWVYIYRRDDEESHYTHTATQHVGDGGP